ncbi:MAG: hypothetical protein DMF89_10365 [Acidobacteria bacterium]|nr:MAG: hypothetical protein DMF89_10365 [Acidobacteriota bacterium]
MANAASSWSWRGTTQSHGSLTRIAPCSPSARLLGGWPLQRQTSLSGLGGRRSQARRTMKPTTEVDRLTVVSVDPRDDPLWRDLVEQAPSSVFHSPSWIRVLSDTYGWEPRAHIVVNDRSQPVAGVPFCRILDVLGSRVVALPFSDYCDPLAPDAESWWLLSDRLLADMCPVTLRCVHNDIPLVDNRFTVVKRAKWHGLDLRPSLETLWRAMHSSAQRAIRKSQRDGVVVRVAESEQELRAFFDLHLTTRKYKYGLLAQPFAFFRHIWRQFLESRQGFLLLAVHDDRIVAGDLFLQWKSALYYKFNASSHDDLPHRPNDLLIWEAIRHAKLHGFTSLDFGLSDSDQEGLLRYKRKFGGEEKTISILRCWPRGLPTPAETELRCLVTRLAERFADKLVPDSVTERAGEDFYRLFA